jgi:hypothetical protein
LPGFNLTLGYTLGYLSLLILIPLCGGFSEDALELDLGASSLRCGHGAAGGRYLQAVVSVPRCWRLPSTPCLV